MYIVNKKNITKRLVGTHDKPFFSPLNPPAGGLKEKDLNVWKQI
jgi:hypothetical protein